MAESTSFPRRQARTRRFTLGAPRDIRIGGDGRRLLFLRSSGPEDPVNSLWEFDCDSSVERLVVDAADFDGADVELPAEERARRERTREAGEGIVAYDATDDLRHAVFALGGRLARVAVGTSEVSLLSGEPGAFDPRLSPDGSSVAYVAGPALRAVIDGGDRLVIEEPGDTVSWGSAEFVAGEEMGRTRGFWWSPDSRRLLVERVDVAPVTEWWIAAPVSPGQAPTPIRYPAAGTANAIVGLAIVGLDGSRLDIEWAAGGWEYLADARWNPDGIWLTVQTRDQRQLGVLQVDPETGGLTERYRVHDDHWVDLVPGAPIVHQDRVVSIEPRGVAHRLCVDGVALTDDGVQVRSVVTADDSGVVISASLEPTSTHIARVSWTGDLDWLTNAAGVHRAVAGGSTLVVASRSLDHDGARTVVRVGGAVVSALADHSEAPAVPLNLRLDRLGASGSAAALLLPSGVDDGASLPVLLDPYGGPGAQRVQHSRALFHGSQWFADQGFAVLVVDGRGTPGRDPEFARSVRGDLATPVLEDQIDALRAAAEIEPRLDLSRVAIRGWSFGGYLAALAILNRPDVFRCAIAGAPVTDWSFYDTHYTERYLGDPTAEPENYVRSEVRVSEQEAGQAERPLMLIHGLADDNVVAAHTLRLSRSLLEQGRPHSVLPLSDVSHMTPQEEVAENLLLVQLEFLRDALGTVDPGES